MTPRPTIALAAAATALALAAPVPPAASHDRAWRTTAAWGLTSSGGEAAVGWVESSNAACENDRKVKLFQVRPGADRVAGIDRRTGHPVGSGDGYLLVTADLVQGKRYYIKVLKKDIGAGAHDHICKAVTSGRVTWSPPA